MLYSLTFMIMMINLLFAQEQNSSFGQNAANTIISAITTTVGLYDKFKPSIIPSLPRKKATKAGNMTNNNTNITKTILTPPSKLFHEYLRCRQLSSTQKLPTPYSCPYDFEDDLRICWKSTENGTFASTTIEYDHGMVHLYDSLRNGIENCTIERFCQSDGTWTPTVSPDIQCKTCLDESRPLKFNSISIMIETMSLSLSLLSLTIAVLCMINVKRLHLPRNLLHMHLFVAFILRSIIKLIFIHSIINGYTRSMITYTRDQCGDIEILSKSSSFIHVFGCRLLSGLFWYTDAVAQTFIFCEAMFLFTALTSHLFRDRGCLLFVLWGWLSPFVWLTMWIASHIITDRIKNRSTCWLEGDNTTYFYYFFYVPYAFYLLVNFGVFVYLVWLLYTKYQSNYTQRNRSGNRHLIKSILILIPLLGLHSLLVMWVFYHKKEGHTIRYYIVVIFKAIFGDLQGFFTSLIYFYFNTEIRQEVLRQVQRRLLSTDAVRRSSGTDTVTTRLSIFRISSHRRGQSSTSGNRVDRRRANSSRPSQSNIRAHQICWRKFLVWLCPCLLRMPLHPQQTPDEEQHRLRRRYTPTPKPIRHHSSVKTPSSIPILTVEDELGAVTKSLLPPTKPFKENIEHEGMTCDTLVMKHENESDELVSDENDVTFHQTSIMTNPSPTLSHSTPVLPQLDQSQRFQWKTHAEQVDQLSLNDVTTKKPLR